MSDQKPKDTPDSAREDGEALAHGLSPEDAKRGGELLLGLGHEMYKRQHYDAARRVLKRTLELDSTLIAAYLLQSLISRELQESVAAVHYAAQAAKLDPKRVDSLMLLTQALLEAGMQDQAIPLLKQMAVVPEAKEWSLQILKDLTGQAPNEGLEDDGSADDEPQT